MFRNFRLSAYLFDLLQIFFFLDQTDRIISLIIQYGAQGKTGRYIQYNAPMWRSNFSNSADNKQGDYTGYQISDFYCFALCTYKKRGKGRNEIKQLTLKIHK